MSRKIIICVLFLISNECKAFFDSIFDKAATIAAVTSGTEDLISSVDEGSGLLEDIESIKKVTNEARDLVSDADGVYSDVEYIMGDTNRLSDLTSAMSVAASKTRRVKRLAKTLGIIMIDSSAASAMETARSNVLLEDIKLMQKEEAADQKLRRYKAAAYIAKRQKIANASMDGSIRRMAHADKTTGIAFHPFTIPNTSAGIQEKVINQIMGVPERQTSFVTLGN